MSGIRVSSSGVSVEVPPGWEAEIDDGAGEPTRIEGPQGSVTEVSMPRLHLANFSLPAGRGDFGSGAVEKMGTGDVLICVLEEDSKMATTVVYGHEGIPQFGVGDFDPNRMQRPIAGQSGAQAFFHVGDRAFVAYVAIGNHARRAGLVAQINNALSTLEFD